MIAANIAYEIHIKYWDIKTNILDADASLYIVGNYWCCEYETNVMVRECMLDFKPVMDCIEKSIENDKKYNTTS